MRILSPQASLRALELASQPYRPQQIVDLTERIKNATNAAELQASVTGVIDEHAVRQIVAMKLALDELYALWAEGKLENKPRIILAV